MTTIPRPVRVLTQREQLQAQARLRDYFSRQGGKMSKVEGTSKTVLAEIGQAMWSHTYRTTASDEVALDNWADYIESLKYVDPERYYVMAQQLRLSDAVIAMQGGARWFGEGLPVYRPGHKRAASFMATTVSAEMAEHVKAPHRAFFIELPNGLLSISDAKGEFHEATGVLVHVATITAERASKEIPPGEYWRWMCVTRSIVTLWEMNRTVGELIAGTVLPEDEYFGIGWEMNDHDMRVRRLVTRLITSLCLDLASGKVLRRKPEPAVRVGKKGSKGALSFNVFLDSTEIDVDARPYVGAFLAGNRKSPEFRQFVGGHWKQQAYGPEFSLRKPIHILPYERLAHLPAKPVKGD